MKMEIKEFFTLMWINLVVLYRNAIEYCKVIARYYGSLSFLKTDFSLILMYLFHNPFTISKRFLQNAGEPNIYAYGETPLTSLEIIAKETQIGTSDCVYELGCGRGRSCFWLNSFTGCSVVGIEHIPEFVERANLIRNKLGIENVTFINEDICNVDYSPATVCYLYGSCLDDVTINKLVEKFSHLAPGTKIITVSFSLADYTDAKWFEIMKRFTVQYTWGIADVYLHIIK